jgi:hypothetical protein
MALLGGVLVAMVLCAVTAGAAEAVTLPSLHMAAGPFRNGEQINLSVGPNHYFKPYSRVVILECADPGGRSGNLPRSVASCDGNTIQGNSVLVNKDGSFSEQGYTLYTLPNRSQLGESADERPVCNATKQCVLYVGENQEDFTWPKVLSHPFTIRKASKHS